MQRTPRPGRSASPRSSRGISLVELMIGLVVGLIITLAITSSVATIGKQFRITGAGHSAAEGAQVAVALIDRDLRGAGAALFNGSFANLCPGYNMYDKGVVTANNSNLYSLHYPVRIESGASATVSDMVEIMVGAPDFYSGEILPIVKEMPSSSDIMKISDTNLASEDQIHVGDTVLVVQAPPNEAKAPCTRFKVTKISGQTQSDQCTSFKTGCNVHFGSTSGDVVNDFNPTNPNTTYTRPVSYGVGSLVFKMPPGWVRPVFEYVQYAVACGALLRYDPMKVDPVALRTTCPATYKNFAMAADIVMLKAQYGISTEGSDQIAVWENAPTAAQYSGFNATQLDEYLKKLQRVKAVRLAMVARSREPDTGTVTAQAPIVFDGAVTLNLSGTPVPAGKTWQHYRYRVHETVVPLRNPLWNR
ncbi:PilW family protein [Aromatoleum evansii]|uniref:PilW family protein n=1 Tax=Aromatoleum evansii TaxID=59406 RepID=A0ABZ1ANX0_AROEV|nr:PilW family protein [Aromatoleum evansii]